MAKRDAWKGESAAPATPGVSSPASRAGGGRAKQVFILAAAILGLVGVIAALVVLIQPPPAPYFVPICITEYKSRTFPVNALANQDREALLRQDGPFSNQSANAFSSQEKQLLVQELKHLASQTGPVVVYLSAFMIVDPAGELVLLPADANPDQPGSWLRFRELLQDLKACPSKHKLLIIDAMRPIADPRIGVLANDVAARAQALLDQVPDPDRFILCSCSPGQVAYASEPLRQSVFGFYVDEGLRGWADGYNTEQKTDGRVSVQELARFVRARVDRWAKLNRGTRQTPVLWGNAEDFNLAVLPSGRAITPRELPPAEEYPPWLIQGWERRDQWWADESYRLAPQLFRELEASLLRAEQQWRGGVESPRVQADLQKQLDALQSQLGQARKAIPRPEPKSLMLALRQRAALPPPPPSEPAKDEKKEEKKEETPLPTAKEMRQLLTKLDEVGRGLKPDEAAAARLKLTDEFTKRFLKLQPLDQAQQVFEVLTDDTFPSPDKVQYLYGFLRQAQPLPLYLETLFLRRLDELASQKTARPWPTDVVRRALNVLREGEKANACDPRIAPWVRTALTQAAQTRHDAEIMLFARGSASMDEADRLFQEAARQYQAVNGSVEILEAALRVYHEALAILPAAVPYFMARPEADARDEQSWTGALELAQAVSEFFSGPPDKLSAGDLQKRIGELQQNADLLRIHVANLTRAFTADLPRLIKEAQRLDFADPLVLQRIELALETPWMKARERVELYQAGRALARKFHDSTRTLDDQENQRKQMTELMPEFDRSRAEKEEQERAARRAQAAIEFLGLGGFPTEGLAKDLAEARRSGKGWASLGHELRRTVADAVPRQIAETSSLPARARLATLIAPFDRVPLLADPATNPRVQLYRVRAGSQLAWLGDQYRYTRRDLPGLAEGRDRLVFDFYEEAARLYLQDAIEPQPEIYLQFGASSETLDFRSEKQSASIKLPVRLAAPPGSAEPAKEIRPVGVILDWLQVGIPEPKLAGPGPWDVPIDIQFRAAGGADPVPAEGFLVQGKVGDRSYHSRVSLLPPIPDSQRLQILVSDTPREPAASLAELRLRPNQKQSVHVFVRNPTESPRKVQIELKAEGVAPALSEPLEVGPMATAKVSFGKPMPPPKGEVPELPELKGNMQLRLVDADKKNLLDEKRLRVSIAQPREYVRIANIRYEPGDKNKLVVQVRPAGRVEGPPCRVQLVLPRDRMPGFQKAESGTFEGLLQGDAEILLTADNLMFDDTVADENGYVYLTVDGYERAFIFRITFARRGTGVAPQEVLRPELRIQAPRFLPPDVPCPVKIETDNSQAGANLEIGIDRDKSGNFSLEPLLQGDRRQRVFFAPVGPEGTLYFETQVTDWALPLNLAGVVGTRDIRARILDNRGGEITRAVQPVTVDRTPPLQLRIVEAGGKPIEAGKPTQVFPNAFLPVIVEGVDPESGVDKVLFYLGKPMDGKLPPTAPMKEGEPINAERTRWRALLPADKEGATDLTVQFINKVGLATLSPTVALHVSKGDTVDPAEKPKPGSIAGTVVEGMRPQPGLDVLLFDPKSTEKDKPKASAKTDENGKFEFKDLDAGTYKVVSSKPVAGRFGEATVVVPPGKVAQVTLALLLK